MSQEQLNRLSRIFSFEKKLRDAQSFVEIRYTVTNELRSIAPFMYAFFGSWTIPNKFKIEAISDIAVVEQTSATTTLAQKIIRQKLRDGSPETHTFTLSKEDLVPARDENPLPDQFLWVPCLSTQKGPQAVLLLVRDEEWSEQEIEYIRHLSSSIGHAMGLSKKIISSKHLQKLFAKLGFSFSF